MKNHRWRLVRGRADYVCKVQKNGFRLIYLNVLLHSWIIVMKKCYSLNEIWLVGILWRNSAKFGSQFDEGERICSENGRLNFSGVGACDEHVMCVVCKLCVMFWNIAAFQCGGWVTSLLSRFSFACMYLLKRSSVVDSYLLSLHSTRSESESENQIRIPHKNDYIAMRLHGVVIVDSDFETAQVKTTANQ